MLFEIFDPKARPRPIGIDLGTTHSLVACVRNERPEAISDCDDEVLLPSVVAYLREGVLVGRDAKKKAALHPRETIVSVKRFMGRGANDPETRALGPYLFADAKEGEANVVRFRIGDRSVTPVEVSAEILRTLKRLAEDELLAVGGAVITVPAYFDDAQRQATKDAGKLALLRPGALRAARAWARQASSASFAHSGDRPPLRMRRAERPGKQASPASWRRRAQGTAPRDPALEIGRAPRRARSRSSDRRPARRPG